MSPLLSATKIPDRGDGRLSDCRPAHAEVLNVFESLHEVDFEVVDSVGVVLGEFVSGFFEVLGVNTGIPW